MNKVFKDLDNPIQRKIPDLLKERDLIAGEMAEEFKITKPSISYPLNILSQANLNTLQKQGQFSIYSLNTKRLDKILTWMKAFRNNDKRQRILDYSHDRFPGRNSGRTDRSLSYSTSQITPLHNSLKV